MKTLHLILKGKWYDLIDCGAKTSEFRACTPYWNRRFLNQTYTYFISFFPWQNNQREKPQKNPNIQPKIVFGRVNTNNKTTPIPIMD